MIWSFRRYRGPDWDLIFPWIRIDHGHLRQRLFGDQSLLFDLKSFLQSIHVSHVVILYLNLLVLFHMLYCDHRRFKAMLCVESLLALLGGKSINRLDAVQRLHSYVLFGLFNIDVCLHSHDRTLWETDSIKPIRSIILLGSWQLFKTQVNDNMPHSIYLHFLTFPLLKVTPLNILLLYVHALRGLIDLDKLSLEFLLLVHLLP